MRYTVAICTWNRADVLAESLLSVATQEAAPPYEILVVDNASTDHTRELVERLAADGARGLRVTQEPRLGLSYARNTALHSAEGDVVVFLDDDARADPWWLRSIDEAFSQHPGAGCIGGPIRLEWLRPRPAWFPSLALLYLGELDLGTAPRILNAWENPRGLNLAVRKELALMIGGFRTDLGRTGASLNSGEEDEFLRRVRREDGEVWWEPRASVVHRVDPERVSVSWLCRRAWMQGVSELVTERAHGRPSSITGSPDGTARRVTIMRLHRAASLLGSRRLGWSNVVILLLQKAGRVYGHALHVAQGKSRSA